MRRARIAARYTPRVPDPVNTTDLWRQSGIDKTEAHRLWRTGQCAGQSYHRGQFVLSRANVERVTQKKTVE